MSLRQTYPDWTPYRNSGESAMAAVSLFEATLDRLATANPSLTFRLTEPISGPRGKLYAVQRRD